MSPPIPPPFVGYIVKQYTHRRHVIITAVAINWSSLCTKHHARADGCETDLIPVFHFWLLPARVRLSNALGYVSNTSKGGACIGRSGSIPITATTTLMHPLHLTHYALPLTIGATANPHAALAPNVALALNAGMRATRIAEGTGVDFSRT